MATASGDSSDVRLVSNLCTYSTFPSVTVFTYGEIETFESNPQEADRRRPQQPRDRGRPRRRPPPAPAPRRPRGQGRRHAGARGGRAVQREQAAEYDPAAATAAAGRAMSVDAGRSDRRREHRHRGQRLGQGGQRRRRRSAANKTIGPLDRVRVDSTERRADDQPGRAGRRQPELAQGRAARPDAARGLHPPREDHPLRSRAHPRAHRPRARLGGARLLRVLQAAGGRTRAPRSSPRPASRRRCSSASRPCSASAARPTPRATSAASR